MIYTPLMVRAILLVVLRTIGVAAFWIVLLPRPWTWRAAARAPAWHLYREKSSGRKANVIGYGRNGTLGAYLWGDARRPAIERRDLTPDDLERIE
jgi:hypothetical protein